VSVFMPLQAMHARGCVPLSGACPFVPISCADIGISSLCTNTQQILMKFRGSNRYHTITYYICYQ